MGNRGSLHNAHREIVRAYQTKRWIICKLAFKGIHREIMSPGLYTELFFLDEASALSAGHRPCAECQRSRFEEFKQIWLKANPGFENRAIRIEEIDAVLHRERFITGTKFTYTAKLKGLPLGAFFSLDGKAYLVASGGYYLWSFTGYVQAEALGFPEEVDVLTPRSIVNSMEVGFIPEIHESASS